MKLNIFSPHIWPDTAPTGNVMRQLLERWAGAGHECHVITTLPWYRNHRVEEKWRGTVWHRQETAWGSVLRLHPCAPAAKSNLLKRAAGFGAFGAYAAAAGMSQLPRADVVFAMSPPLTLAAAAGVTAHRSPLVLNLQDLHPDAAIATGAITSPIAVAALRWLERFSYHQASAITVLSEGAKTAVEPRAPTTTRVEVIPNFAASESVQPGERNSSFRRELGIAEETVVFMYAGNVGFSQPLDLIEAASAQLADRDDVCFVINGNGAAIEKVRGWAGDRPNVVLSDYQPAARLSEVLATADVHLVLLAAGLGHVSVPSKIYAAFRAARPVLAAAEADSEVAQMLRSTGAGLAVAPLESAAFVETVVGLADDPTKRAAMAAAALQSASLHSPDAAAAAYLKLFESLA